MNNLPRIPRSKYPPGYYHVMSRGVGREGIFSANGDKTFYRNLAGKVFSDYSFDILAYCIMGNHFHFVVRGNLDDFSHALHRVNLSFAMNYNFRQNRVGHVFQNRFKSELIDSENYLFAAIRYVHNNPVKGKIVTDPANYPWSSYREFFQSQEKNFITKKEIRMEILNHFEKSPGVFQRFHKSKDSILFLDTQEDIKERKVELAMNLIENYFPGVDLENREELTTDLLRLYRLVALLLEKTTLSHRDIADLTGLNKSHVGRISKRINQSEKAKEVTFLN